MLPLEITQWEFLATNKVFIFDKSFKHEESFATVRKISCTMFLIFFMAQFILNINILCTGILSRPTISNVS